MDKDILRDRAKKLPEITDEMWALVNKEFVSLVDEFLQTKTSKQTKKQYLSRLKQFGWYMYNSMNNKEYYTITKRDMMRFINWLQNDRMLSSSAINLYKSAISSLNNYIELFIVDDDVNYKLFRNFVKGLPTVDRTKTYSTEPISEEEFNLLVETLMSDKNYIVLAYIAMLNYSGMRRNAIRQIKSEIVNYHRDDDKNYILLHPVKDKGDSARYNEYMLDKKALPYIELWLNNRGYEHEYIFTVNYDNKIEQISEAWGNYVHENILSDIVGRRLTPHLWKHTIITRLLEQGVDKELVSKFVAHHKNVNTTSIYDNREFEEERKNIF